MAAALAGLAILAWSDSVKLTRSPLCGPSCSDDAIAAALTAPTGEFAGKLDPALKASALQRGQAPFDTGAWVRLSLLQMRAGGGQLTPQAASSLLTSYDRAPVDATIAAWRIPLVFTYWAKAPPKLRAAAINEVRVLHAPPQNQPALRGYIARIRSYEGRFAYQMLVEGLDEAAYRPAGLETPSPMPKLRLQTEAIAGS